MMLDFGTSKILFWGLEIKFVENYFFRENYIIQREQFFTMFYTINLSPLLYYPNNYFEWLTKVSTAFTDIILNSQDIC